MAISTSAVPGVPGVAPANAPFQLRAILAPLVAIIIGVFMVMLDSTAMNVAVPGLVSGLHSTLATVQWTITGYALAQAAVIPLAGWLSDRYGARRVFARSRSSPSARFSAPRPRPMARSSPFASCRVSGAAS